MLYEVITVKVGTIIRELCQQKGVELVEGKAMSDHIHLCLSIPPKYSVSHVVGYLKGKSAIVITSYSIHYTKLYDCDGRSDSCIQYFWLIRLKKY